MGRVKVVIGGGGWCGCAAALSAKKAGAAVTLLERTDQLLGTGLVGGIMRNNGRFTAAEEAIAMGAGDLFEICDRVARHRNIDFPGHSHATLYDVARVEPAVRRHLLDQGIEIHLESRVTGVEMDGKRVNALVDENENRYDGDVFVDATGTAGPQGNCTKYGNGCAMCVLRCPSFGPRVSIASKAGVKEFIGGTSKGTLGSMSGSCKLLKDSLAREIVETLDKTGVAVIPVPEDLRKKDALAFKCCQQYALAEFAENLVLLDTGHAKLMTPYFPLEILRQIPGMENARFEDPYAGGKGNSMRYFAISPRDDYLKVDGMDNLFCGGEKAGPLVGHTEAIVTGALAGHNAVRHGLGMDLLKIPESTAIGDAIALVGRLVKSGEGLNQKYTFSGSVYFERMKGLGLYTTDSAAIRQRVRDAGVEGALAKRLA
ncbi:MAG: FAD-dependent oxidoreductase [Ignavibacteriales bacterium]